MNQPDQVNMPSSREVIAHNHYPELTNEEHEASKPVREWFPEDEDEWYEPDYCKNDRRVY